MRVLLAALAFACVLGGCGPRPDDKVQNALMTKGDISALQRTAAQAPYRVGCPDVLAVVVTGRPEITGRRPVHANGCIDLGPLGGLRVEGLSTREVEAEIAGFAAVEPADVQVAVAEYRSQQVYLFGQVTGRQRAVPYQGPETVLELLRRAGGVTADGAADEVQVVRNPGLERANPEVFRINLRAILMEGDPRSNIIIQPYDQVYIPETKEARVGRCLHPWLRSLGKWFGTLMPGE